MPYISKNKGVIQVNVGKPVDYYHVELPNYFTDNIICENLVTESCGYNQVKQGSVVYFGNKILGGFTRASENSAKSNLSTLIKNYKPNKYNAQQSKYKLRYIING